MTETGLPVALVTCRALGGLDPDDEPLVPALASVGLAGRAVVWDDPKVEWAAFSAVVVRSTWDYHLRLDEFLAWAGAVSERTSLLNPLPVIRWNAHKRYLQELERRGAPVVPTVHLAARERADLEALMRARGWDEVVIKPAVSLDSFATVRAALPAPAPGQAHLDTHLAERDMMIQPLLESVATTGERCLVFLDGRFSHAVRKRSLFLGGRHAGPEGIPVGVEDDERAAAEAIVDLAGARSLLYARVDLARNAAGVPLLLELELTEPTLFLRGAPGAADRLAAALASRIAAGYSSSS